MSKLEVAKGPVATNGTPGLLEGVSASSGYGRALASGISHPDTIGRAVRICLRRDRLAEGASPSPDRAIVEYKLEILLGEASAKLAHHMGRFGKAILEKKSPEELIGIARSASDDGHGTFALTILEDVFLAYKKFSKDAATLPLITAVRTEVLKRMDPCLVTLTAHRELGWKNGPSATREEIVALKALLNAAHGAIDTKSFLGLAVAAGEISKHIFRDPVIAEHIRNARLQLIPCISVDSGTVIADALRVLAGLPRFDDIVEKAFFERLPKLPQGPASMPFTPQIRFEIARFLKEEIPSYFDDPGRRLELNEVRAALLSARVAGGPVPNRDLDDLFEVMGLKSTDITPLLRAVNNPDPVQRALTVCNIYRSLGWLLGTKQGDADEGLIEARLDILKSLPKEGPRRDELRDAITKNLPPLTDEEQDMLDSKSQ